MTAAERFLKYVDVYKRQCLFYTFNAIEGQGVMAYLAAAQSDMVRVIQVLIDIFSVFVSVVLACLIVYADRFLMRRRKRELGRCV